MFDLSLQEFHLADHYRWSLRSVEWPFVDGNQEPAFHTILMLMDEKPAGLCILDELHFTPVDRNGIDDGRARAEEAGPTRPKELMLGAAVFARSFRGLEKVNAFVYDTGSPRYILNIWNNALRVAQEIRALQRPFGETANCRAGIKGVVESLGYTFQTIPHPKTRRGMDINLAKEIDFVPVHDFDDTNLLENTRILRQNLKRRLRHTIKVMALENDS